MAEAMRFVLSVFFKQGLWIFGLAWLLSAGGWVMFARRDSSSKSRAAELAAMKRKAAVGGLVLVLGILMAL